MRNICLLVILALLTVPLAAAAAPTDAIAMENYLKKLNVKFKRGEQGEYLFELGFPNEKKEKFLVKVMPQVKLVYIAIVDIHRIASVGPRSEATFRKMAELNYKLAVGKLEWDPQTTMIRLSHTFAAEDGIDFATFKSMVQTLLTQAPEVRKALKKAK